MGVKEWVYRGQSIDDKIIREVENYLDVKLPADYKECIKVNNGGRPRPNVFDSDDGGEGFVFRSLISFTKKELNIKMFKEELDTLKILPFATDPFGNYICFDYRYTEDSPTIVFYNHEFDSINPVCDTFTALIERLYDGEELEESLE